jgi:hypothetical protein
MDLDSSKNASKCAKTHVRAFEISKISPGVIPPDPVLGEGESRGGEEGNGGRKGAERVTRGMGMEVYRRGGGREGGKGRRGGRERNS